MLENNKAGNLDIDDELVKKVIRIMKIRSKKAIKDNSEVVSKTDKHIDKLMNEWQKLIEYEKDELGGRMPKIRYSKNNDDDSYSNLICNFEEEIGLWETLQSMRNVESSASLKLLGWVAKNNA